MAWRCRFLTARGPACTRNTKALYKDSDATLDDVRKVVATLEDLALTARRVFGSAHPITGDIENDLRESRAALRARETSPGSQ